MVNKYKQKIGSRRQVMNGTAKMTSGGLTKRQLKYNKQGKIVSRKASNYAKKDNRLVKAGYITRKGHFGVIKVGGGNNNKIEPNQKKIYAYINNKKDRVYFNDSSGNTKWSIPNYTEEIKKIKKNINKIKENITNPSKQKSNQINSSQKKSKKDKIIEEIFNTFKSYVEINMSRLLKLLNKLKDKLNNKSKKGTFTRSKKRQKNLESMIEILKKIVSNLTIIQLKLRDFFKKICNDPCENSKDINFKDINFKGNDIESKNKEQITKTFILFSDEYKKLLEIYNAENSINPLGVLTTEQKNKMESLLVEVGAQILPKLKDMLTRLSGIDDISEKNNIEKVLKYLTDILDGYGKTKQSKKL